MHSFLKRNTFHHCLDLEASPVASSLEADKRPWQTALLSSQPWRPFQVIKIISAPGHFLHCMWPSTSHIPLLSSPFGGLAAGGLLPHSGGRWGWRDSWAAGAVDVFSVDILGTIGKSVSVLAASISVFQTAELHDCVYTLAGR